MVDDFQTKAAELMKKALMVGVGAFFLTEESLRTMVSDFKLPKELLAGILDSAHKSKEEFLKTLSREMMTQVMERVDPSALLQELVSKNEVEFTVKVNFKRKKAEREESEEL